MAVYAAALPSTTLDPLTALGLLMLLVLLTGVVLGVLLAVRWIQ